MNALVVTARREEGRALHAVAAWAESGLMDLSGPPDGEPAIPAFDAMSSIDALFEAVEHLASSSGRRVTCDPRLLTERAALQSLTRQGHLSCNSSCRLIEARDGWIAVNLARATDLESVPAFVGCSVEAEPWSAIERAARSMSAADLVEHGQLLGLAVAEVPHDAHDDTLPRSAEEPVPVRPIAARRNPQRNWRRDPPLVIDLSTLWAGPLCGELLAAAGARVIKVECVGRPDTIRLSSPAFFDLLNAHKESVALDFTNALDRKRLRSLIARADVVISSARPRAFERLGLDPESLVAEHAGLTWVAITAQGWTGPRRNWVGFGDDAAVAGGLVTRTPDGRPMFAGDALADPITGIAAAAGALRGIARGGGVMVDASLTATAAFVAAGPRLQERERGRVIREHGSWRVSLGEVSAMVKPPCARLSAGRAAPLGADTERVLDALLN